MSKPDISQSTYKKIAYGVLIILCVVSMTFGYVVYSMRGDAYLHIAFLDIGQGDAIYIKAPNGTEVLLDGGADRSVLRQLSSVMSIFDNSIDMLIVSNPDKDHIGGFIPVLSKFHVSYLVEPGTRSPSDTYRTMEDIAKTKSLPVILARDGMKLMLDKARNIYIDILFPDRDVSDFKTNDGSIVAKLVYGDTSVLLQGDAPQSVEEYLIYKHKGELDADILKVGHHGSRTSTSKNYVTEVTPEYAVISSGAGNSYGHPHKETLDTLQVMGVEILRTDTLGRIEFASDGHKFVRVD